MGEISKGDVSVLEDDSLLRSKELTLVTPHLEEAPFVEFCSDVVMGSDTPSLEHTDLICSKLFDLAHISVPFPLPPPLMCMHTMSP